MPNKTYKKINLRNKKSIQSKKGGSAVEIGYGKNVMVNSLNTNQPQIPIRNRGEIINPFNKPEKINSEQTDKLQGGKKKISKKKGGNQNIPVDINTRVPTLQRWTNPQIMAPNQQYQGGIYTGPQAYGPWGVIPVTPITSNMIHQNLISAYPPPGANVQYPGTNHLGNNFSSMPGIKWYNNTTEMNPGQFRIKGTPCTQKGGKRKKQNNKSKKKGGKQNIPVDIKTNIISTQQWTNPQVVAPLSQYQGGIYTGPQAYGPWGFIPVTPTTSNMINNNLKSASPPPGATVQYPGNNRLGNNFSAMPGISWYNDTTDMNPGEFRIKGTSCNSGGKTRKNKKHKK